MVHPVTRNEGLNLYTNSIFRLSAYCCKPYKVGRIRHPDDAICHCLQPRLH